MSSPFVAEIRIFAGNFAPTGWAECNGQLLPISQNTALFSLLGTFYGGNGQTTFALPNLQGAAPMHQGQGPGLSEHFLGESAGEPFVTLLTSEMPLHAHSSVGADVQGNVSSPAGNFFAGDSTVRQWVSSAPNSDMSFQTVGPTGGSLPHNNMQPYLVLLFIIAMQGVFPPRT
jgi:microcystin-dependent protein